MCAKLREQSIATMLAEESRPSSANNLYTLEKELLRLSGVLLMSPRSL